jgi:hypothetical protein
MALSIRFNGATVQFTSLCAHTLSNIGPESVLNYALDLAFVRCNDLMQKKSAYLLYLSVERLTHCAPHHPYCLKEKIYHSPMKWKQLSWSLLPRTKLGELMQMLRQNNDYLIIFL